MTLTLYFIFSVYVQVVNPRLLDLVRRGGNQSNRSKHNAQRLRNYGNSYGGGMNDYRNRSQMRPQQMQHQRPANGASGTFNASPAAGLQQQQQANRQYTNNQGIQSAASNPFDRNRTFAPWNATQKQTFPKPQLDPLSVAASIFDPSEMAEAKINRLHIEYRKAQAAASMQPAQQSNYPVIMAPALSSFSVPPPALIYSYPPPHALPVKN